MAKCLAPLLVLVVGVYLCHTAQVNFTHQPYTNSSNILMNCSYTLNKASEFFKSVNVTKDSNYWFYSYDNSTKLSGGRFRSVAGVNQVRILSPGVFVVPNINRTTAGTYNCSVYYNNYGYTRVASKTFKIKVN